MVKYKKETITVLQLGDTILSLDILDKQFCCDIKKCKGACCIEGDSGAPLTKEEMEKVEEVFPVIKSRIRKEGLEAINEQGVHMVDADGDNVTPLINGKECAYTYFEDGICMCVFEKAFHEGVIDFQKPVSCHLYPIRVKKYKDFDAVNYDKWDICKNAVVKGKRENIKLYEFCKTPMIRKYGEEWYKQVEYSAKNLDILPKKNN